MASFSDTDNYRELFLSDTPLMDVRAPIEFNNGAFPCSANIPLLDDRQRELVGTQYKKNGQQAAIELGWQLATPDVQENRLQQWQAFIEQHPKGYLYCFRGGLRSRLSQQLLSKSGINYPLIQGGYKAMRRFLIDELENNALNANFMLVAGRTCSGKTLVLKQLSSVIDLEALANHRGSAFGRQPQQQPSQIDFENALSIDLIKHCEHSSKTILIEDESKLIGRLVVPKTLLCAMRKTSVIMVEETIDQRIKIAIQEYIVDALIEYQQLLGENLGRQQFNEDLLQNIDKIKKRFGGERHGKLRQALLQQLKDFEKVDDETVFAPTIHRLLAEYYDPMYDYQLQQRESEILFKGNVTSVVEWAKQIDEN
ncbi:MAG: tRNA 2-selenouridine(34) synthase MnmH [Methylococcales bacterium]|jgi:tRNA 2-selenouridine synthase|nr:tRNA 2-selenouridine(34) synthase MnmH [Methylococcales bacterium]MBT7409934.1 tRNA 2-selenouridine(34) synthase MnmH [Methylococcales bacterium]